MQGNTLFIALPVGAVRAKINNISIFCRILRVSMTKATYYLCNRHSAFFLPGGVVGLSDAVNH